MRSIPVLLMVLCTLPAFADDPREAVLGRWASEGSILEVSDEGGALSARVIAIKDAVYKPGEAGTAGSPRRDDRNPEPALQSRFIVGIDLLSNYRFDNGKWRGRIYDPESGNFYSSQMKIGNDGRLEMRGYVGVPWLGRTVLWDPVSSCKPHIVEMLATIEAATPCG